MLPVQGMGVREAVEGGRGGAPGVRAVWLLRRELGWTGWVSRNEGKECTVAAGQAGSPGSPAGAQGPGAGVLCVCVQTDEPATECRRTHKTSVPTP